MDNITLKGALKLLSITLLIVGLVEMLYSIQFLFSSKIEDLVGAGFSLVTGSILCIGGLISLSICVRNKK